MLRARTLPLAVLAVAAVVLPGCGGDSDDSGGGGGDDESQVGDVVAAYVAAVADHDGAKACGYLSKVMLAQFEEMASELKVDGCAGVMDKITGGASDTHVNRVIIVEVSSVKISGNRATARMKVDSGNSSPASLVKESGVWKIAPDQAGSPQAATAQPPTVATITTP